MATSRKPWSSREEYKKAKELEEARKAGTAPPEQDEEGRDINPHIPMYIAQAPWYLNSGKPGLKHQRKHNFQEEKEQKYDGIESWYPRGKFKEAATGFRKGACTNCGAMTHKQKDCVERPRKIAAKWTGKDIKPDEIVTEVNLDYEGKRDRWNGFDPRMYAQVMERYQEMDEARRKKLAEDLKKFMTEPDSVHKRYPYTADKDSSEVPAGKLVDDITKDPDLERAEFEDEEGKDSDRFTKRDPRTRTTVRNLRIREDRAKYLHNLDPDSAFYDPKSRSMRENPYDGKNPDEVTFAGDNFMRASGDSQAFYEMQHFAWESYTGKGEVPNIFAEPSQAAVLFESAKKQRKEFEQQIKNKLTQEYGGDEFTRVPPRVLLLGQTEIYQEYAPDGSLISGKEVIPKSKYEEDKLVNGHSHVWGSYYCRATGKWGYKCCLLLDKLADCTRGFANAVGPAGVPLGMGAEDEGVAALKLKMQEKFKEDKETEEKEKSKEDEKEKKKKKKDKSSSSTSSSSGSESDEEDSSSSSSSSSEKKKKKKSSKSKRKSKSKKRNSKKNKKKKKNTASSGSTSGSSSPTPP